MTTSSYWDAKAARTVAAADAETRLAEAEATRAETMLRVQTQRLALQAQQDEHADQARTRRLETQARARRERRAERERRRREGRQRRRHTIEAVAGAVGEWAPLLVGGVAMGAPIAIAWDGQLQFGQAVMRLGALAAAVPVALEGSAWYLAWLTHKAVQADRPTGRLRLWTWLLALMAASMNLWHGITGAEFGADGLQVGIVRGLASLLGVGLWELTVMARRQRNAGRSLAELRTVLWRRLRYPRLSWQAAGILAARGPACRADEAWLAAWIDRYGLGPDASRPERRLARRIIRRQARKDRQAVKAGRLSMVGGLVLGRAIPIIIPDRPGTPTPATASPVVPAVSIDVVRIDPGARRSPKRRPASIDRPVRASIEPVGGDSDRAPRRSIAEHRTILQRLIGRGVLTAQSTAEDIRKTLRCAPRTAAALKKELTQEVSR
ncbi:DUF2637 domain-containing protein [Nonomuraea typhae]|uniref:DUF2637 domain-containing protein n=1 Tax=Nonomuraea typhae TaxID=2603600 RepID=UPI0012F801EE|nr:DUF2637 domain-containing protein [Nonomuraea typhae]